ncbi:hypothetical protein L3Q82_003812 [Scortum barcoo]|uniref:Uncharacterized protein n=1 Tax=Scortum barcoo TaxID=214431 RepID=A0ACB8X6A3_9TELE|nr:hypothetical protein L3Q82_003812 [Scortum barcoo]
MFSASIVDACSLKLWTQGLWCLSWWQSPNPVVDTGSKGCRQAEEGVLSDHVGLWDSWTQLTGTGRPSKPQPGTVLEAKTRVWEEFGEAMEEDSIGRPRRDSGKPSGASEGGSSTLPTLFTVQGGELLTSTEDIVETVEEILFEDLLNPTDLPSSEEAGAGDSEVDSSITRA